MREDLVALSVLGTSESPQIKVRYWRQDLRGGEVALENVSVQGLAVDDGRLTS